ncbi:DNA photolyase, FAD-binding/Cryptochrome [Lobosporangium transversale]|uniref:DNA photolyase, FAD-binding/Cryptochrome n=1 Tax=Lobosporangium transversale TaxID=64571 RepID=A0A1Y2GZ19_9FUNG|nr:DNA photolyase, FAD-binding/Cryptochrome [Lobosporangium transversale]ORZ27516.1 DNA photolyase, FAD-binding/Cryptochrome [Lobosporangium transversale]|eukprot:XP_021885243.1 DNA photolyase, FAD-binding/Cryptochrome [Lobosporangium transversale]
MKAPGSAMEEEQDQHDPSIKTRNTLMWFRTDLRLQDNKALYEASMRSKVGARHLIALYIISEDEWKEHDEAPIKIDFWMRNLTSLKKDLDRLAIPLVTKTAKDIADIPTLVEQVVKEMDISHVFWNADLMIDEQRRDAAVKKSLMKLPGVAVEECNCECIVDPADIKTKTGNPYSVFTPYYNNWCKLVETEQHYLELTGPPEANPPEAKDIFADIFKTVPSGSYPHSLDIKMVNELYPAGEDAAHERLKSFLQSKVKKYREARDVPVQDGTSLMSPYLTSGVVTTRQCVAIARAANNNKIVSGDEGIKAWIRELGWKEFYKNILISFPRVCMGRAFQPKTEKVQWSDNMEHFQRWCEDKTGFPIVDAGMRQLNATGYMHNRLRMITACFLVKDLLIDWRLGERYFMNSLIDGDLANNNGGWQWSASTGTDAQPYFRVFNPLLQSQRFDPKGSYIRKWVPELRGLNDKQIHDPSHILHPKDFAKLGYPKPIVDHAVAKKKYVDEFKRILAL